MSKKKKLNDCILIDFFLSVGLPKSMVIEIVKEVETKFKGDYSSEETFNWVNKFIRNHNIVIKSNNKMILSLYPDCLSDKMREDDPRKNYLDKEKMNKLA